jgi:hypothetical protein
LEPPSEFSIEDEDRFDIPTFLRKQADWTSKWSVDSGQSSVVNGKIIYEDLKFVILDLVDLFLRTDNW